MLTSPSNLVHANPPWRRLSEFELALDCPLPLLLVLTKLHLASTRLMIRGLPRDINGCLCQSAGQYGQELMRARRVKARRPLLPGGKESLPYAATTLFKFTWTPRYNLQVMSWKSWDSRFAPPDLWY